MFDRVEFRRSIQMALFEHNMTQKELADKLNTSPKNVSKWITGARIIPKDYWEELDTLLQVDIREFLREKRVMNTDILELNQVSSMVEIKAIVDKIMNNMPSGGFADITALKYIAERALILSICDVYKTYKIFEEDEGVYELKWENVAEDLGVLFLDCVIDSRSGSCGYQESLHNIYDAYIQFLRILRAYSNTIIDKYMDRGIDYPEVPVVKEKFGQELFALGVRSAEELMSVLPKSETAFVAPLMVYLAILKEKIMEVC